MAKRKKLATSAESEPFLPGRNELAEQLSYLMESLETYTKHRVECFVCMVSDSARDITEAKYARYLHKKGWRNVESESLQTIGIMCPECTKTPDSERAR